MSELESGEWCGWLDVLHVACHTRLRRPLFESSNARLAGDNSNAQVGLALRFKFWGKHISPYGKLNMGKLIDTFS